MQYFILSLLASLLFAVVLHLRNQFRQTNKIRQDLSAARADRVTTGLHSLRK